MLDEGVRGGISEKVPFEQKPEGSEGASHVGIGVGVALGRGHNQCKGPEAKSASGGLRRGKRGQG